MEFSANEIALVVWLAVLTVAVGAIVTRRRAKPVGLVAFGARDRERITVICSSTASRASIADKAAQAMSRMHRLR